MNRTPHSVNNGTGTLAKARYERQQAGLANQAAKAERLAVARTPQADKAREYKLHGKHVDFIDLNRPARMVFETALELFLSATAVRDGATTIKGTIDVAVDAAAEQHKDLFEDLQTQADAIRGADWAKAALKWAGRKIFDQKVAPPAKNQELVSA